jgi:hypothetical protein
MVLGIRGRRNIYASEALKAGRFNALADILDVQISLASGDPTGAVVNGLIRLRGALNRVSLQTEHSESPCMRWSLYVDGVSITNEVSLDKLPAGSSGEIFCLPMPELYYLGCR